MPLLSQMDEKEYGTDAYPLISRANDAEVGQNIDLDENDAKEVSGDLSLDNSTIPQLSLEESVHHNTCCGIRCFVILCVGMTGLTSILLGVCIHEQYVIYNEHYVDMTRNSMTIKPT